MSEPTTGTLSRSDLDMPLREYIDAIEADNKRLRGRIATPERVMAALKAAAPHMPIIYEVNGTGMVAEVNSTVLDVFMEALEDTDK